MLLDIELGAMQSLLLWITPNYFWRHDSIGYIFVLTAFLTRAPWKSTAQAVERVKDVKQRPSDNDNVVDVLEEDHDDSRISDPLEYRTKLANNTHPTNSEVLTNTDFQKKQRNAAGKHGNKIGN